MLPFVVQFQSGKPVYDQVLLAIRRALTAGQLKPGDRFPSVRVLSQELRINPGTAHKIIGTLVDEGLLAVQPGVGSVVTHAEPATAQQRQELVDPEIERLVLDARMLSLSLDELISAMQKIWRRLEKD
jgi:GntR family transcriptional regulator